MNHVLSLHPKSMPTICGNYDDKFHSLTFYRICKCFRFDSTLAQNLNGLSMYAFFLRIHVHIKKICWKYYARNIFSRTAKTLWLYIVCLCMRSCVLSFLFSHSHGRQSLKNWRLVFYAREFYTKLDLHDYAVMLFIEN